jgi:hypothetical protein
MIVQVIFDADIVWYHMVPNHILAMIHEIAKMRRLKKYVPT